MKGKIATTLAVAALLLSSACPGQAEEATRLGILSWNGPFRAIRQWQATSDYLAERLGRPVTIVPLEFKQVLPAVEEGKVDFLVAEPSLFMTAKVRHGVVPLATMKAESGLDRFGAVIFAAARNRNLGCLHHLKGRKLGAVHRWSFAGWHLAEKEFENAGIDSYRFVSTLRFFEKPQAVVKAVLAGTVDAGTVRTGVLEDMAAKGEIKLEDVKILGRKHHADFPHAVSTALYPQWPLARTATTDQQLGNQLAAALLALPADHEAVKAAGITGWTEPADYSAVDEIQRQLRIGSHAVASGNALVRTNGRQEFAR